MARPPIHPGEILGDELQEIGITPTELARQIEVPANRITQILHGDPAALAAGVKAVWDAIKAVRAATPAPRRSSGSISRALTTFVSPRPGRAGKSQDSRCAPAPWPERRRADQRSEAS